MRKGQGTKSRRNGRGRKWEPRRVNVVLRVNDAERAAEIVDAMEDVCGIKVTEEKTEGEWCVAIFTPPAGEEAQSIVRDLIGITETQVGAELDSPYSATVSIELGRPWGPH